MPALQATQGAASPFHTHTHTHTHMYTHTHTYIYMHAYIYSYTYMYIRTYTYMHICRLPDENKIRRVYPHHRQHKALHRHYIHTHTHTYIYMYALIYLYTCMYIRTYMYMHICRLPDEDKIWLVCPRYRQHKALHRHFIHCIARPLQLDRNLHTYIHNHIHTCI